MRLLAVIFPAIVPVAMQSLLLGSVALGLGFLLLTALGYLPALGGTSLGLTAFHAALAYPGLPRAVLASLISGFCATLIATALSLALVAALNPLDRKSVV